MRHLLLESLHIENFRSCKDVLIDFDDYTCLVGTNGTGKSTVLQALNILFRYSRDTSTDLINLGKEDFYKGNISAPIVITATFGSLSNDASTELQHYVRQGKFIMKTRATWNSVEEFAEVEQLGVRMVMPHFSEYFKMFDRGEKAEELKKLYKSYREEFPTLPSVSSKGDMYQALRDFEESHEELCQAMNSTVQLYGFTKGENKLNRFLKWVYVPAVKDAASEREESRKSVIAELLERTVRTKVNFTDSLEELRKVATEHYRKIVEQQQHQLDEVSGALEEKLKKWAHPGARIQLNWDTSSDKSVSITPPNAHAKVGEGDFIGEISRMGHGMQRSFIVALLQELAMTGQEAEPTLLLGFEEPELYQHPPQARYLASILEGLSKGNAQVTLTTHSPLFISSKGFENLRMIRKRRDDGATVVTKATYEKISNRLACALGGEPISPTSQMAIIEQILQPSLNELFFCGLPILVEGIEDVAFLSTYMTLYDILHEFRRLGGHFIVCNGKRSMSRPLAIALELKMPHFVIFDADSDNTIAGAPKDNQLSNGCLLKLCSKDTIDPLTTVTIWGDNVVVWGTRIGDEIRNELLADVWDSAQQQVCQKFGYSDLTSNQKKKNVMIITATLIHLYDQGKRSEQLRKVCERILEYGKESAKVILNA